MKRGILSCIDLADQTPDTDEAAPPTSTRRPFHLPRPPLRSATISLRPWTPDFGDALTLARAWNDPDVVRWTTVPEDRSVEAARRWISSDDERRSRGLSLDLAVTAANEPDRIFGEVGIVVAEVERGWAEIGYWTFPEARGEGHATAAVSLLSDWALGELDLTCLFARTNAENPASGAVAKAAGYDLVGNLDGGVSVWARRPAPEDDE